MAATYRDSAHADIPCRRWRVAIAVQCLLLPSRSKKQFGEAAAACDARPCFDACHDFLLNTVHTPGLCGSYCGDIAAVYAVQVNPLLSTHREGSKQGNRAYGELAGYTAATLSHVPWALFVGQNAPVSPELANTLMPKAPIAWKDCSKNRVAMVWPSSTPP